MNLKSVLSSDAVAEMEKFRSRIKDGEERQAAKRARLEKLRQRNRLIALGKTLRY